jgi:hypothetical protein
MSCNVFANGMEVACKSSSGKSVACFPDVCFTPPQAPPTPPGVPLPYPNTGWASDTTGGSKSVKMHTKEVMLKNKSYFRKSGGDEAGRAPLKGILTHTSGGKVYFNAWSMNVKVEGENVVRNLDLTTHNHGSVPGNTPPWPFLASMAIGPDDDPCAKDRAKEQEACGGKTRDEQCKDKPCAAAQACQLVPKGKDKKMCCPGSNTGHHLIEDHWIRDSSGALLPGFAGLAAKGSNGRFVKKGGPYNGAPTVCADGNRYETKHGKLHASSGTVEETMIGKPFNYGQGKAIALKAHEQAFPKSSCEMACLEAQMDSFYGSDPNKGLRAPEAKQPMTKDQRAQGKAMFGIG